MMFRHLTTSGLILSLALIPLSASAYITPDQALDEQTLTTRFLAPPPSGRAIPDVIEQQRLESEQRRNAALDAIKPKSSSSASSQDLHGAAPAENQTDIDKMIELVKLLQTSQNSSAAAGTTHNGLDPVTQRLLIRVQAQQAENEREALIRSLVGENGGTLHSGAPLTESGPATILIALAAIGAIAETWRRVRKAQGKMSV